MSTYQSTNINCSLCNDYDLIRMQQLSTCAPCLSSSPANVPRPLYPAQAEVHSNSSGRTFQAYPTNSPSQPIGLPCHKPQQSDTYCSHLIQYDLAIAPEPPPFLRPLRATHDANSPGKKRLLPKSEDSTPSTSLPWIVPNTRKTVILPPPRTIPSRDVPQCNVGTSHYTDCSRHLPPPIVSTFAQAMRQSSHSQPSTDARKTSQRVIHDSSHLASPHPLPTDTPSIQTLSKAGAAACHPAHYKRLASSQPLWGAVRKTRRYPKFLSFNIHGIPISARDTPGVSKSITSDASKTSEATVARKSASYEWARQLLRQELEKIQQIAKGRGHKKMNLRGRMRIAAWLQSASSEKLKAAKMAIAKLDIDASVLTSNNLELHHVLSFMRNTTLRVLDALLERLTAKKGGANWEFVLRHIEADVDDPASVESRPKSLEPPSMKRISNSVHRQEGNDVSHEYVTK